jgi:hypothetical protein
MPRRDSVTSRLTKYRRKEVMQETKRKESYSIYVVKGSFGRHCRNALVTSWILISTFPARVDAFNLLEAIGLRGPESYVAITVQYNPRRCSESWPLLIRITNNSNRSLDSVVFDVVGRMPGRSTYIYDTSSGLGYLTDYIIEPSRTLDVCESIPRSGISMGFLPYDRTLQRQLYTYELRERDYPPENIEWRASIRSVTPSP